MPLPVNDDDIYIQIDPDAAPGDGSDEARPEDVALEWAIRSQHRALQREGVSVSADLTRRPKVTTANRGIFWRAPIIVYPDTSRIWTTLVFYHFARQTDLESETPDGQRLYQTVYVPGEGTLEETQAVPLETNASGSGVLQWTRLEAPVDVDRVTVAYIHLEYEAALFESTRQEIVGTDNKTTDINDSTDPSFWPTGVVKPPPGRKKDYPNGPAWCIERLESDAFARKVWDVHGTIKDGNGSDTQERWIASEIGPWVSIYDHGERFGVAPELDVQMYYTPMTWLDPQSVEVHTDRAQTDDIADSGIQRAIPIDAAYSAWQHARESKETWSRDRLTVLPDLSAEAPQEAAPRDTWSWVDKSTTTTVIDASCRPRMREPETDVAMLLRWSLVAAYTQGLEGVDVDLEQILSEAGEVRMSYSATIRQLEAGDGDWSQATTVGSESWTETTDLLPTYRVGNVPILQTLYYGNADDILTTGDITPIDRDIYREGILYDKDLGALDIHSRQVTMSAADYDARRPVRVELTASIDAVTDTPETVEGADAVIEDSWLQAVITDASGYLKKPGTVL